VGITVRLTPEEYAEMERRRALAGYRGLSGYCRDALLRQPLPRAVVPPVNVAEFGALHNLASNINQLPKHLNVGNIVAGPEAEELGVLLEETVTEVKKLRRALMGATLFVEE